ncbi:MAG: phosphoribosylformylglycinamidine cyclo-ligase [Candidatus Eisenbacteria bacterium]|uniref:Phosphoribosylformylglycinamidine cyclo-ligase n=1 Tax=Eiseniibacteriota bacterium TaxID=2212470 RepID=A0A948RVK7_UNCEI|nr:phosphoribosylformylglycinamidine cyclo-ligase [Candidatus Eisenbacteria bacterium]MBU1949625.1 phosphoribosylformylglycinamidine cyclo-ligase [Candidatus Eisenbacteria bacterium]MBU2690373.1 phosphoribosylformylglycinamidine cyclo-ligase [Candidatus Eisenbacteria bacterium]
MDRYKEAGVDRGRADLVRQRIGALCQSTYGSNVVSGVGGFGGCIALPKASDQSILVASVDGVGTKMRVAALTGMWEAVGYDIVAHGVNDVLVQGAEPLFFLDYIAMSRLDPEIIGRMADGMVKACREAGCALLGGETAEMPGIYAPGDVELVGTMVGVVERERLIDGSCLESGDILIGLPSSGLHTNGYTLARHVLLDRGDLQWTDIPPSLQISVGEALMKSHTLYLPHVRPLLQAGLVKAMAHITGGGILENIPRVLPKNLDARILNNSWDVPALFRLIQERGDVAEKEMFRVFNMGIGWVLMIDREDLPRTGEKLGVDGIDYWVLGELVKGEGKVVIVEPPC